ncbi:pseudouridine-5'-phosphate glycosidase-like isoform X2 [Palaemon carinicauda]
MLRKSLGIFKDFKLSRMRFHLLCQKYRHSSSCIVINKDIQEAVSFHQPVVALESTIITHGMPYPLNIETALAVEDLIKKEGALPATVGILGGKVYVGLSQEQLQILAEKKTPCMKTSRRDFPYVLAKGINGGTTVSGTMLVAQKAGIDIFVTGGIGGVHRGAESSFDISADLTELGRTPVTVVSAGVKSILDVERTLEYLETQGVCVTVMGPDATFPDFFTRNSGYKAPSHVESPYLAALMMKKWTELDMASGMLVAVPIPKEYEAEGQVIKDAIEIAVKEAAVSVRGRDVTPFVLQRVLEITGGESLKSNVALIKNNAITGAQISVEFCKLKDISNSSMPVETLRQVSKSTTSSLARPVVIGGSIVDFIAMVKEPEIKCLQPHFSCDLRMGGLGGLIALQYRLSHQNHCLILPGWREGLGTDHMYIWSV